MQHLAAAREAAQAKLAQAKYAAQNIDIDRLKGQAAAAANTLQAKATSGLQQGMAMAGDLMDKVVQKEMVTIDGQGPFLLVKQIAEGGFGFVVSSP